MPLPPSVDREELHLRRIEMRGYRRSDGLYDIEARLTDTKSHTFQRDEGSIFAGVPLHDMWLRLVVDEDLLWCNAQCSGQLEKLDDCQIELAPQLDVADDLRAEACVRDSGS